MTTVYGGGGFRLVFRPRKTGPQSPPSLPKRRRSSYSNFRIVCCGGLWQEIRDHERPLSLKRDDLGILPNSGSIDGITRRMLILKKLRRFGLALLFVGLFAHSSHAQKVTTEWAKGFNFGELKYFAWRKNNLVTVRNPEGSKILDQKIMHVVTQALASKGIVEDSTNPDFYLFYHAGPGDEGLQVAAAPPEGLDSIQPPDLAPTGSNTWSVGAGSSAGLAPNVWYSVQGKFVFYAVDCKSKVVIWQGTATKKWYDPQKARKNEDKEISQIVNKSFKNFPPKTKK